MIGGHVAHPLLISLANIQRKHHNKTSNHAFLLVALLPIVQFVHQNSRIHTVHSNRLVHQCLNIILEPLKQAARLGWMMSDLSGNSHLCYTALASYIIDMPEAGMLAGVHGLMLHVMMAIYKNFGDSFHHPPRLKQTTLSQLTSIAMNPVNVETFFKTCKEFHPNGISNPFWRHWPLSEPSIFFTPELLHYWFHEFYDHDFG